MCVARVHGGAQDVAEQRERAHGLRRLAIADERHDRVEAVEEKVRLQLHAERAELRVAQLRFALAQASGVRQRVREDDDREVGDGRRGQPAEEPARRRAEESRPGSGGAPG